MLNTPFSPWPSFSEEEAIAVHNVIKSNRVNYWTGTECRSFEDEFANWSQTNHAIALANGTVALDLALKGIGLRPDDEVIVTPRTFIASVSCVANLGAKPVFADVDIDSGNITANTIEAVLTPSTKAIICVHLAGWPCDMDPIMELARKRGIKVIEDCAQAHGASYKGRSVGSIGDIAAWSFCQDKIMSTGGEGGMVTTNDEATWRTMWAYKDHGKSFKAVYETQHPQGFRWLHESFGTNWRMTEMQAAIGRIQLRKMKEWSIKRQENANILLKALEPFSHDSGPLRIPYIKNAKRGLPQPSATTHANYKFYAYVRPDSLKPDWNRDRIIAEITSRGVPCYQGTCSEVYLEKAFENTTFRPPSPLPHARELGETSVMLLIHPTLTSLEMEKTVEATTKVLRLAAQNHAPIE
ncbi:DegT/DnrJ/EryC1/StrS aminotransferase family protein [Thalassospira sp. SN3W]|uniref:DegT/DnrJ/EryC1/StrS family aminotransferase n=1 Tax=Thalassospira sp. SN3W TaxID=3035476 RepID=UPI00311B3A7A